MTVGLGPLDQRLVQWSNGYYVAVLDWDETLDSRLSKAVGPTFFWTNEKHIPTPPYDIRPKRL